MSAEEPHDRFCAGCQILELRTAIDEVLDGGFAISETARRILATAVGRPVAKKACQWPQGCSRDPEHGWYMPLSASELQLCTQHDWELEDHLTEIGCRRIPNGPESE